jgi:threonine synthase
MQYYSTNNHQLKVSLKEAVIAGLASDGGLLMPERIPDLPEGFIKHIRQYNFRELSMLVAGSFFSGDVPGAILEQIVTEAINFETPLVRVSDNIYTLELFHGPTLAFKDIGARFMARLLGYFVGGLDQPVHVLVATSGDTGSAVASGFCGVPGIHVHILYPSGLVSNIQEKQFTTLGQNITALEVDGSFDDCQRLVKTTFLDPALRSRLFLTSANSINLARLIPQTFYYFNILAQLPPEHKNLVIAVPSGNFGNLTAGILAWKMGLPVHRFIAATNINDVVPEYLHSGIFTPRPSCPTIANAMDVGNPSNFIRILDLFNNSHEEICRMIGASVSTDDQMRNTIRKVWQDNHYLLEPHGATGNRSLSEITEPGITGVFLETAHPAKFQETVEEIIGEEVPVPARLADYLGREKQSVRISGDFREFKEYLNDFPGQK